MLFLSMISLAQAEPLVAESPQAIAIHFSEQGFDHLGEGIAGLFPDVIPLEGGTGVLDCSDGTALDYTVGDIEINLNIDQIDIYTDNGCWSLTLWAHLIHPAQHLTPVGNVLCLKT